MLNISAEMLNRNIAYTKYTKCKSKFHEQIMDSWNKVHNNSCPTKTVEILNQNILYNQLIKVNNTHVTGKHLTNGKCNKSQSHTLKIIEVVNNNGNFLSHTEINDKLDLQISKWNWMLLTTAIPRTWKTKIANDTGIQLLLEIN